MEPSTLHQSAKLFQVVAGGDGFHSSVPSSLFLRRTYLRIKSAYECREAEDGGRLGGQEGQHGQREGPAVGVRGRHGRPRVEADAAAASELGPVEGAAEAGVAATGGGADAHVALVAQEAGEHDEGAAEHHAWNRHNGFETVQVWLGWLL